jgi:hypothetical protein
MKTLDSRETAAVLAGLRLLQHWMDETDPDDDGIQDILENGGDIITMNANEIEDLCEKINTGEKA